jgi:hypothetical protein
MAPGKKQQEARDRIAAMPKGDAKKKAKALIDKQTQGGKGALSDKELANLNKIIGGTAQGAADAQAATKTAVGVDTTTDAQGNVIRTTTWSDGTSSTQNLGPSGATQRERTDWISELSNTFTNFGLSSLVPKITEFIQQGFSYDTVTLRLQETPEYKQRFSANEARRKTGLPVLSPAEYLNLEQGYRQVARTAGLPEGFYDSIDDFSNFITNDVSPVEFQERVDIASNAIMNSDPFYTDSLRRMYGLDTGEMIAYALDPQRALPSLTKVARAVEFGTAAARQGFTPSVSVAEQYAGMGVTRQQAEQGFQAISQVLPETERLQNVFGRQTPGQYGLEEAASEVFGGPMSTEAMQRRKRLSEMEQSLFAGQSGVTRGSFAKGQAGQF